MAQETDAQLATRSLVIRNETVDGANTKERHDDMNQALIDSKINNDKIDTANTLDTASKTVPGRDAVKAYITAQINALINAAPGALDTLDELANALGDDPNFAATVTAALAGKAVPTDFIGVQDLFIPASAMWPRFTGGCAAIAKSELATSVLNIQTLDFDQTTQEFAQFTVVLPRKWNNGTVTATFYWTAAAGAGDVQWGIKGVAYSNDDSLTSAFGSAQTVDDTLLALNDLHITTATAAITLGGSPASSDFLGFEISRNPAADTLTGDAKLLGISLRLTTTAGKDA